MSSSRRSIIKATKAIKGVGHVVCDTIFNKVNSLFVPTLGLSLVHIPYNSPYIWHNGNFRFILNGSVIWDFPTQYMGDDTPSEQSLGHWGHKAYRGGMTMVESLCREYLDCPRDKLFEPFDGDHWGVIEALRAGDRRIGFRRLTMAALMMGSNNEAARQILAVRFAAKGF